MAASYKLRCNVVGHEKDVRALAPTVIPQDGFVSGSRDITARIWLPNEQDGGFIEGHRVGGHSNFIAAVCVMPPNENYPHGLIFTGSNDTTIMAFSLESTEPVFKLTGHTGTVCSLATGKFGTLVSGSWDTTAKVWLNAKCMMTLSGHEAAVWAVAMLPEQGITLTGSADKTIKLWKAGRCEKTFQGHEDCVRGLAVLSGAEFLSCSNDATVRRWLVSGECVHTYYGHSNYIYSLAVMPNGEDFVTGSEDRTAKVWRGGECTQTIAHPTQSVWAVCCLPNGDFVTGASDGIIRLFTTSSDRVASPADQIAYEEQVSASSIPTQIGDIKTEDLPDPQALLNPGDKDGQTKMVKEDGKIMVYQWNSGETRWVKIGDVVGSSGGSTATSGKVLYQGKEYDYVFDVDLQEGTPPLKLPYNIADDPWFAAQTFLQNNDLSPTFLDQVAKFIQDQTKGVTLGVGTPAFCDPLTGGGRYVPGSGKQSTDVNGADPFTGGGRHIPGGDSGTVPSGITSKAADPFTGGSSYHSGESVSSGNNAFFPQKSYLYFETANKTQIMSKLREFNEKVEPSLRLDESTLNDLNSKFVSGTFSLPDLQILTSLLNWPADLVFPVLDILRYSVSHTTVNQYICTDGKPALEALLSFISPSAPASNRMLTLRLLCNLFRHSDGENFNVEHRHAIFAAGLSCLPGSTKQIQVAFCTCLLNHCVNLLKGKGDADSQFKSFAVCVDLLNHPNLDSEAVFRVLVSFGTLMSIDTTGSAKKLEKEIQALATKRDLPKKVSDCSKHILHLLSSL